MMFDRPSVRALRIERPAGAVTFPVTFDLPSDLLDPLLDHARSQSISLEDAVLHAVRLALFPPTLIIRLDAAGNPTITTGPAQPAGG